MTEEVGQLQVESARPGNEIIAALLDLSRPIIYENSELCYCALEFCVNSFVGKDQENVFRHLPKEGTQNAPRSGANSERLTSFAKSAGLYTFSWAYPYRKIRDIGLQIKAQNARCCSRCSR